MVLSNNTGKEISKKEKQKEFLIKISNTLKNADIKEKEVENIISKINKFIKARLANEKISKILQLLTMKNIFRNKFLKTSFRKLPRLLAEFGVNIQLQLEINPRQAESTETYGQQFPKMAVDPNGEWIIQAGNTSSKGMYRIEIFKLINDNINYYHPLEFFVAGQDLSISVNPVVKDVVFSPKGNFVWIPIGTEPNKGAFTTWLIKLNTNDWSHEILGPVDKYEYYNRFYSRSHFKNMKVVNEEGTEKIIAPIPLYQNALAIYDPISLQTEYFYVDAKPFDRPNFRIRFTDIALNENLLFATGWAEGANDNGIRNPHASIAVIDMNDRSIVYGPSYIPEMMGYYDYSNNSIWPLKIRPSIDKKGVYLIAKDLAPVNSGGKEPNHSGFAYINLETNDILVKTNYLYDRDGIKVQFVNDIIEFGGNRYLQLFKKDFNYNIWHGLIRLDNNLNPTENGKPFPISWWNQVYAEPHPIRPQDVVLSAVQNIYHPNLPSGTVAVWEAF